MQNKLLSQVEKYEENRKHHKSWLRIVSALACVVVFVTTYMLILPAVTLEQTAYCGCEEHQHGDACYEETLICGESENEHVHTEECYKKTLVCQLEEHEHSLACYANPNADVESASVWEQSVSGAELTGIWADDVLAVAQTQLGYEESIQNYIVTEDG